MDSDLLKLVYSDEDDLREKVQALLQRGANPNEITSYGESPLRVASNSGRFDVVRLLLDSGADASQLGWTDVFFLVAFSPVDALESKLHTKPDLSARDYWDRTPWLLAFQTGSVEKSDMLLRAGADPDVCGRCGKTPIAYAVEGNHVDLLRWLLSRGMDIESTNAGGDTPLITAAAYGSTECVKLLIESGANIFAQNAIPYRAIEEADDLDVVKTLLVRAKQDTQARP